MIITLGSVNLPKPDYSQLYAQTIEEYSDFINRANNSLNKEDRIDYCASACMRLLKTSNLVSFIMKLLENACLQTCDLEPQILNACNMLWTNKTPFHLISDQYYDFTTVLNETGKHVTDTADSIIAFGERQPPAPPAFTTLKAAHMLKAPKHYDDLRDYFIELQRYCDRREIIVGIHDQVKMPNGYYPGPEIPLTYHQVLDLYFTINDNAKYRPSFNTFLSERKFEGWEKEVEFYRSAPVEVRRPGRPKKTVTPEQAVKIARYEAIKQKYNDHMKLLTDLKNEYMEKKAELMEDFEKYKMELEAAKRDM